MNDKRKPCPFCGSDWITRADDNVIYMHCEKCGACGPEADTESAALVRWNTRTEQEPTA